MINRIVELRADLAAAEAHILLLTVERDALRTQLQNLSTNSAKIDTSPNDVTLARTNENE